MPKKPDHLKKVKKLELAFTEEHFASLQERLTIVNRTRDQEFALPPLSLTEFVRRCAGIFGEVYERESEEEGQFRTHLLFAALTESELSELQELQITPFNVRRTKRGLAPLTTSEVFQILIHEWIEGERPRFKFQYEKELEEYESSVDRTRQVIGGLQQELSAFKIDCQMKSEENLILTLELTRAGLRTMSDEGRKEAEEIEKRRGLTPRVLR